MLHRKEALAFGVQEKRFDIAVGSTKGLAYLHDECLEWVLHCDPKVADFGLPKLGLLKLLNRGGRQNFSFSKV
ncbi:hypothetical protein ACSBR1_000589 [Camellia fascicularis]